MRTSATNPPTFGEIGSMWPSTWALAVGAGAGEAGGWGGGGARTGGAGRVSLWFVPPPPRLEPLAGLGQLVLGEPQPLGRDRLLRRRGPEVQERSRHIGGDLLLQV